MLERPDKSPIDFNINDSRYNEKAKLFLSLLSPEQLEQLKQRKYYHVTTVNKANLILKQGLVREAAASSDEDFDFLKDLYEKYGDWRQKRLFESMVLGRAIEGARSVSLSTKPDLKMYQIPERVTFLLRNLQLLASASYTSEEEKQRCREILVRYQEQFTKPENAVCVLSISLISPQILNRILPDGIEAGHLDLIFNSLMTFNNVDAKLDEDISPEYIQVEETHNLDAEALNVMLGGRAIGFLPDRSANVVQREELTPAAQSVYDKFERENDRPPTMHELQNRLQS